MNISLIHNPATVCHVNDIQRIRMYVRYFKTLLLNVTENINGYFLQDVLQNSPKAIQMAAKFRLLTSARRLNGGVAQGRGFQLGILLHCSATCIHIQPTILGDIFHW